MTRTNWISCAAAALSLAACRGDEAARPTEPPAVRGSAVVQKDAERFLADYNAAFQRLTTAASEAEWVSGTHVVEGDQTNAARTRAAKEALAAYTGSPMKIETIRSYLKLERDLTPIQVRQLRAALFEAGDNPGTVPELVKQRIAAETAQKEKLDGFRFQLDGKPLTPNEIDTGLKNETNLDQRKRIWEASKEIGAVLRPGLIELRRLRNECVQALDYHDYFSYMASEYGLTTVELAERIERINRELRPLFRELHTWARHELAHRYGQPVPDLIPAHWLPNRWGQDWSSLVEVPGFDLDAQIKSKPPEWCVEQAERFYQSLGFGALPKSFWTKSSL